MMDFLNMTVGPFILADWFSGVFMLAGAFFTIVGVIGILRLPDVFSRMHGAGMVDTLGLNMILIGLMFQADEWIVVAKLFLILLFIFFTSPTTTFALARAAIHGGVNPGPTKDELSSSATAKEKEDVSSKS